MSDKIAYDVAIWALKDLTRAIENRAGYTEEELIEKLIDAMLKDKEAEGGIDVNWWNKFVVTNSLMSSEGFFKLCTSQLLND